MTSSWVITTWKNRVWSLIHVLIAHTQAENNQLFWQSHHSDVTMSAMASQISGASIVYSTVGSGADQGKHQSTASLVFVMGIHRWPVNSLHKWPVTRKMLMTSSWSWDSFYLRFFIWAHNPSFLINMHLAVSHWRRVTHICVSKITGIGLHNGLSPGRRQASIWTNTGILSIGPLGMNFILIEIRLFSFKKMHLKMSSAKWRLFRLGVNVLNEE